MEKPRKQTARRGSRGICRLADVSQTAVARLSRGEMETGGWTEWMATDMSRLARTVARTTKHSRLKRGLLDAADKAEGRTILGRLQIFGSAIARAIADFEDPAFHKITHHRSDVVRQWGVYAVNSDGHRYSLGERLALTLPFAADQHMSVRECAWMAFRPYVANDLSMALELLQAVARSDNANVRRFATEVTRPRSVWGAHISALKEHPEQAVALLDNVSQDVSRYVRLSVGNWLNDASKTRPDWVRAVCLRWSQNANKHTEEIIRRGLRTLASGTPARGRRVFVGCATPASGSVLSEVVPRRAIC